MVDKWISNGGGESGILKKLKPQPIITENHDELLIFGYACKVFRDDEKALYIDKGRQLIPWNGDNSLKIDRYDVRATLSDITQYEAPQGGYTNRLECLSASEQKAEQLCEEERYYSLYHNEMEEEMYQEEELKRLHQMRFGQVGYSYDNPNQKNPEVKVDEESEEPDEVFVPVPNFEIPTNIILPDTMKEHAIIEKTAKFISTQGAQMEILIKTKQANNSQFDFLNHNSRLFHYYRHILSSMKNGIYPFNEAKDDNIKTELNSDTNYTPGDDEIHLKPPIYPERPIVPALKYKPSANCAYTQLISKITGVPLPTENSTKQPSIAQSVPILENSNSNQQYYDYTPGFYGQTNSNSSTPAVIQSVPTPPPSTELLKVNDEKLIEKLTNNSDGVLVNKISGGLLLAQYYNSDSETEEEEEPEPEPNFPFPPESLQNIIDKTAGYVKKNGKDFENILRTKDDPRMGFLDEKNEFHRYYLYKVTGRVQPLPKPAVVQKIEEIKSKIPAPVSFSIKYKEEPAVPIKPGLQQETSSDEDGTSKNLDNTNVPKEIVETDVNVVENSAEVLEKIEEQKEKDARRAAQEKIRDKLAAAAREKLSLISKEKQLQLERKKRAMAFLNQMKSTGVLPTTESTSITTVRNDPSQNHKVKTDSDSDNVSIHSIPSSPKEREPIQIEKISYIEVKSRTQSRSRSRSRSQSTSSRHKRKKSKHSHSKKKSKRKSRSRSRSPSRDRKYRKHPSRQRSNSRDRDRSSRYRD